MEKACELLTEDELKDFDWANRGCGLFGDDRMLIQQFVCPYESRHIEIQIVGDKHGYAAFLVESSIQRRNQKFLKNVVNFAEPETRKKMHRPYCCASPLGIFLLARRIYCRQRTNFIFGNEHSTSSRTSSDRNGNWRRLNEQMIRVSAGNAAKRTARPC